MTVLVVDAGALVVALADDEADGDLVRARLRGETLAAPQLIDLEVTSVLRRLTATSALPRRRAELALDDLIDLPIQRAPHTALLGRCWELRHNLTPYDAAYVALAEACDATLITTDARLQTAPGTRCTVELVSPGAAA